MPQKKRGADRVLGAGRRIRLVDRDGWEFAERLGASGVVVIVAVTRQKNLLLIEQHRPPVGGPVIELPAGLSGDIEGQEDEPLAEAARRELLEETGYQARGMKFLMAGPVSAGLSSERVSLFRATGLKKIGPGGGDASEEITVHEVPLARAAAWLSRRAAEGTPADPKVYAGLYFATR